MFDMSVEFKKVWLRNSEMCQRKSERPTLESSDHWQDLWWNEEGGNSLCLLNRVYPFSSLTFRGPTKHHCELLLTRQENIFLKTRSYQLHHKICRIAAYPKTRRDSKHLQSCSWWFLMNYWFLLVTNLPNNWPVSFRIWRTGVQCRWRVTRK